MSLATSRPGGVKGAIRPIAEREGARASLTVIGGGRQVEEHVHDHPYLSLHVLGGYREHGEAGEREIDGPAAVFHPAGASHEDAVGGSGLATVVIEFEPAWLRKALGPWPRLDQSRYWIGGAVGERAERLARAWVSARNADACLRATADLIGWAARLRDSSVDADRLQVIENAMDDGGLERLAEARQVRGSWLVRDYRRRRGEGLQQTQRRRRVERAVRLIETSPLPLAQIALAAGFCDQSHMNRAFRLLLGATPAKLRANPRGLTRAA